MSKTFIAVLLVSFLSNILYAQSTALMVEGTFPNLHLTHTVVPKENWYSIGRIYNISPKEIAPFNGVTIEKPLSIGEKIRIPLTTNFLQNGRKAPDEVLVPVYHVVQDKEKMSRISTSYNNVAIEDLERWNKVKRDQVKAGMKLVIGYLKVKKDQSSFAAKSLPTTEFPTTTPVVKSEERKKEPVVKKDESQDHGAVAVEEKKKEDKPEIPAEEKKPAISKTVSQAEGNANVNGGYFRALYEQSGKAATGTAGIFKSTSGWQDAKYYALMNNVPVGTVVAVSNPSNNRVVYTKVLGQLPDMKESVGLTIRISDAAASELEAGDAKFAVNIKY